MPSDGAALGARCVSYVYDQTEVVHDVSCSLEPGVMLALVGPNGSGKTTLLKLLSGVLRPKKGTVTLDDVPVGQFSGRERALKIAVVSQQIDARLMFTVEQIVAMGRMPHTRFFGSFQSDDTAAIHEALVTAEVEHLASRRFSELSGGEQQRVLLAVALAQQARYLLLDEPTVHLDLHHQHALLEVLIQLRAQRGVGILAVVHDLNLASLYFERLALMHASKLVDYGPTSQVLTKTENLALFRAPLRQVPHPTMGVPQVLLDRQP